MKRRLSLIIAILICVSIVFAQPTTTLNPDQIFETKEIGFNLSINNYMQSGSINSVKITIPGLTITDAADYFFWDRTFNQNQIIWTNGTIETNVILVLFEFIAKANKVDQDTNVTVQIDLDGNIQTKQIVILNDDSAPLISNQIPIDGDLIREGISNQQLQLNAIDPETEIEFVEFLYQNCDLSDNQTTVDLNDIGNDLYTSNTDLSTYVNEEEICFNFIAENKGGTQTKSTGKLIVDGTSPKVTLFSPDEDVLIRSLDNFEFVAIDNLAQTMDCEILIDGSASISAIANNNQTTSVLSTSMTEGEHTWQVSCADSVGLIGTSEQRSYTLDLTPPQIDLVRPKGDLVFKESVTIEFSVTDNYGLDTVTYEYEGNPYNGSENFIPDIVLKDGVNTITVTATDNVGNTATREFTFTVDKTKPIITLVAPKDNEESDVHVNFAFNAEDTYDDELDCELFIDDTRTDSIKSQSGNQTTISKVLAIGTYSWIVECTDDADNKQISEERTLEVIDTTGPDIIFNDPEYAIRGSNLVFEFEVIDVSGVDQVSAEVLDPSGDRIDSTFTNNGLTYTVIITTDVNSTVGNYIIQVSANDTLGNTNLANDAVALIEDYIITLELHKNPTTVDKEVVAKINVTKDDGTKTKEGIVTLYYPEENKQLNSDNVSYTHPFKAPSTPGTYEIRVVFNATNGYSYEAIEALIVNSGKNNGGGNGGSGGGSGGGNGGGLTSWKNDGGSSGGSGGANQDAPTQEEIPTLQEEGMIDIVDEAPLGESGFIEEPMDGTGSSTRGIGHAFGLFDLERSSWLLWLLALLVVVGIIAFLTKVGWKKDEEDSLDMDSYLEKLQKK